jgi:hypothetical protein
MNVVWLACTLSFILGLPSLGSSVAFSAATSIATIGLYISYGELSATSLKYLSDLLFDAADHERDSHCTSSDLS